MFKNLFKIAVRNLVKDKIYSLINILGLTIGITCSLLLFMYILDELSYDRYHKNADNIYRIVSSIKEPDNAFTWAVAQVPMGEELRDNYPEVENVVRFFGTPRTLLKQGETQFYESDLYLADSTVFDMFNYTFLAGDEETALDNPFSMVLTESIAKKYFGTADVIGRALQNEENEEFKITGVIRDVPLNSHFRFDGLISRSTRPQYQGSWGNFGVFTYIQLPAGYDLSRMQEVFDKIVKERVNPIFEQFNIVISYELQRITDIHLHSKIQDEAEAGGDISYIYIFASVAVFMLIIACINYMNLTTARSTNRAKEVGIRKVMGSQRNQLVAQFMAESVVVTLIALVVSLGLIYILLPFFNDLANKQLPYGYIVQAPVMIALMLVVVVVGVLGGSYPAFYLSGFNPVNVLKGRVSTRGGNVLFRKVLVVFQFCISIFMLISTLIVFDQLEYLRNKDLGFDKEQLIRIDLTGPEVRERADILAEKLKLRADVEGVGKSTASPGAGVGKLLFKVEDNEGKMVDRGVDLYSADYDFVKTMGMTIVKGRDFSRDIISDTSYAILVNEAMVNRMGWDEPLGKKFSISGDDSGIERQVIGVLKDYHQNSLYDAIEPLIVILDLNRTNFVFVRIAKGDVRQSLAGIEQTWKEVNPNDPFEFLFLDQDFNSQYKADEKRSQIFTIFSSLTIIIACLGLLGLSAFTTEQRTKEIGVRKVIGASVNNLVMLVSKEFFILVGLGLVIAVPLAWYFTESWLESFAYRIDLKGEWLTFIVSALLAFVITFLTVGFHVIRAATSNPVNTLRTE